VDSWRYVHFVSMFKAHNILKFFVEQMHFDTDTLSTFTNNGWSPFLLSVRAEDFSSTKYLLDCKVDVNTLSKKLGTGLHIAVQVKN